MGMMKYKRKIIFIFWGRFFVFCISTLGNKKLLNVCFVGKLYNKNGTGRVECGITMWNREKFNWDEV